MSIIPQFTQTEFIRVCGKLGLNIITSGGRGSHVKVRHEASGRFLIVPQKIKKGLAVRLIKDLESWGYDRDEVINLFR